MLFRSSVVSSSGPHIIADDYLAEMCRNGERDSEKKTPFELRDVSERDLSETPVVHELRLLICFEPNSASSRCKNRT